MSEDGLTTLLDAVGLYRSSVKSKKSQVQTQQELVRFAQWQGQHRHFDDLDPSEIEEYAQQTMGSRSREDAVGRLQSVRKFLLFANKNGFSNRNLATHIRITRSKTTKSERDDSTPTITRLTKEGYKILEEQLKNLQQQRPPLAEEIRRAAADKDVRENVPLEAAREELGRVESRISEIEHTLQTSVIMSGDSLESSNVVKIGSKVKLKDIDSGRETTYTLVTAMESNPLSGKISDASPVGKAMQGKMAGEEMDVVTPGGKTRYSVIKVVG